MRVVLLKDVPNLGKRGDIKTVSDGYGRNFLIGNHLAEMLTPQIEKRLTSEKEVAAKTKTALKEKMLVLKEKIEKAKIKFKTKLGEAGRVFGSITPAKIVAELEKHGINLEKNQVLSEPIKTLGEHQIKIKLPHGIEAALHISIEPEGAESK